MIDKWRGKDVNDTTGGEDRIKMVGDGEMLGKSTRRVQKKRKESKEQVKKEEKEDEKKDWKKIKEE